MISKDHVTLKTGVMVAENSALHQRNKLDFKMYLHSKQLTIIIIVIIFHNIMFFTLF